MNSSVFFIKQDIKFVDTLDRVTLTKAATGGHRPVGLTFCVSFCVAVQLELQLLPTNAEHACVFGALQRRLALRSLSKAPSPSSQLLHPSPPMDWTQ